MMGFLGLKGLELIVDKWFGDKGTAALEEMKRTPAKRTRKPKNPEAPKARKR